GQTSSVVNSWANHHKSSDNPICLVDLSVSVAITSRQMTQSIQPETLLSAEVASGSASTPSLKFGKSDRFIKELRRRVDAYFRETGLRQRDCPNMYLKTAIIMTWLI